MRRFRHLTGQHRTSDSNRRLGLLLAFNAGAINAGGFLVVKLYTSHMTGFLSMLADHLVLGNTVLVLGALGALLAFVSGAAVTTILIHWAKKRKLHSTYALPLLIEAMLMLAFGLLGAATLHWRTPFAVPATVLLLSFIMGLQNATVTKMSAAQIRTTHMTGTITDLGIELGKLLYWNHSDADPPGPRIQGHADGQEAEAILRKCVHCGFCTATCPTYQLLGDELDGPRGRIYLIKQVLEGARRHAQDAAAPGPLPDLPQLRDHLPQRRAVRPPGGHRPQDGRRQGAAPGRRAAVRWLLKEGLTSPLFGPAMKLGQLVRPLLPAALKDKVPRAPAARPPVAHAHAQAQGADAGLGCVQPAMMPNINSATARVLDAAGIQTLVADEAGCCGAIRTHLNDQDGGLADMRATSTPGGRWWRASPAKARSRPS
jgi:uncharacterized membrane protein YoaK (UPF0700 family)